jgi:predicted RNA polymerase sigma factor
VERLRDSLADFQPWYAAYAALLEKVGRHADAQIAYERAIADAPTAADSQFLQKRLDELAAAGRAEA